MEGVPKSEVIKNPENFDSVEVAKGLYEKLQAYENADVVGREALSEVESLAQALTVELKKIPAQERREAGLPWHPYDAVTATNNDNYAMSA